MANGRNPKRRGHDTSRDSGLFIALPVSVMDCPAYSRLSHPARSLLWEIARQYVRDNNGRLLASKAYLEPRGWKSADVITRAKRELLEAGFIHETVMGHRPNKASWYAVTWRSLDKISGYDAGAAESFRRGAYAAGNSIKPKATREELYEKWRSAGNGNASLTPSGGVGKASIAPSHGVERSPPTPSHGAIKTTFDALPTPSHGNHLEKPSTRTLGLQGLLTSTGHADRFQWLTPDKADFILRLVNEPIEFENQPRQMETLLRNQRGAICA